MKTIFRGVLVLVAGAFVLLLSLQSLTSPAKIDEQINLATLVATPDNAVEISEPVNIDDIPFQDNMEIYQNDEPNSVVTIYVTVRKGNPSDNTDHTWQEINDFTKWFYGSFIQVVVDKAEAIVQFGDDSGPLPGEVGYGEIVPNATIQIRGASTSDAAQKSYKIELRNRAGEWRGQKTIALNKHFFDFTRVRNKLNFDLMKDIPNIVSLRTQFVHLYVKDETIEPPSETFVDYGLYTQIEQPNKKFLRNHLLDSDGQLYKTTFFEFHRYEEDIRLADDPLYDEEAFGTKLEIKGNRDHSKLIQMLDDVNNYAIPIEQVFEAYFNSDNYFTWLAFNILVGNIDTQSQNFYLYSPKNSQTWYFIPWDYDGSLNRLYEQYFNYPERPSWEIGISNYWGVVLHKRVLTNKEYRAKLDEKVNELMAFLTPERINSMVEGYRTVTDGYLNQMPDLYYISGRGGDRDILYSLIPDEIQLNYELYKESLEMPMPFFLGTPEVFNGELIFKWGEAYDFDAQNIEYKFILSKDWEFKEILYEESLVNLTELKIAMLEPGTYFWMVTATNEDGKTQQSFDEYRDAERNRHEGMKVLYITSGGQVLEE